MYDCISITTYLIPASAGGHVQHSPVLRGVDVLATEHGVDLAAQVSSLCEIQKKLRRTCCCQHIMPLVNTHCMKTNANNRAVQGCVQGMLSEFGCAVPPEFKD